MSGLCISQHPIKIVRFPLQLEAFRAQKAAAKALKNVPAIQPVSTLQEHHGSASSPASPADTTGSDVLSRAPSVLPVSTHAGPLSYGGSDVEAPDNRKLLTRRFTPPGEAAGQSIPMYPESSAPEPLVPIPFTGRDSTDSSSSTQQQTPQSAGAAAVPATSNPSPVVPVKYQSRLPPPPPVFRPPVRSQAGREQSHPADNSGSVQPSSPLPFRPGLLLGATKAVSSSLSQAPVCPPVQMFHPATALSSSTGFQQQAAPPSSSAISSTTAAATAAAAPPTAAPTAAPTAGRPTSSYRHAWSLFGSAQSNKEPTAPTAAAAAGDESAEAAEAAARQSAAEEEASQLTLVNELRMLPEVSTRRDVDTTGRSGDSRKVLRISQSSDVGSPFSEQVCSSSCRWAKSAALQIGWCHVFDCCAAAFG